MHLSPELFAQHAQALRDQAQHDRAVREARAAQPARPSLLARLSLRPRLRPA
ncbi:hypothetical protein L1280_000665 [Deinococcus sp. HSC-46F16]|uniref:hypothetical protein n=1 Tax=Deinococcus sp. HSC-46F16 TaxID=2910968 RepID=UPI0020A0F0A1|nr:hypothetical protein [Deinococcus sp. HSC-46F16]MCP2013537.1 hypothetical protein [Deinococcus sp. HSC-46F16]